MTTGPYYSAADAALNGLRLGISSTPKEKEKMASPKVTNAEMRTASSPRVDATKGMNFSNALEAIREGKHVTRLEWQDPEYYCLMYDYRLCLHKPDGKPYSWIINDGDMAGEDWVIL